MLVTYRDELGMVEVVVDGYNVGFVDGFAFFSSEDKNYKIPVGLLICISKIG